MVDCKSKIVFTSEYDKEYGCVETESIGGRDKIWTKTEICWKNFTAIRKRGGKANLYSEIR